MISFHFTEHNIQVEHGLVAGIAPFVCDDSDSDLVCF